MKKPKLIRKKAFPKPITRSPEERAKLGELRGTDNIFGLPNKEEGKDS